MDKKLFSEFPPISTEQWEEQIKIDLKGADYDKKLVWHTIDGININPYYREEDLKKLEHISALPDSYPYVRGNNKDTNDWEIRQDIYVAGISKANDIAIDAIKKGANAIGFDVKNIEKVDDFNKLLKGIDLSKTAIHFISSKSYPATADLFVKYISSIGVDAKKLKGSFNFDPFSYLLLHGEFYTTLENNFVEGIYLMNAVGKSLPNFKSLTINGHYFHNAGSSIVQELGFSLASANDYVANLVGKGLPIDEIAQKIMFSFAVGSNYFMEIAKLRAARMLWAKIIEQYKPKQESSYKMHIHCSTSLWNKTMYDPYVNMLRTTTEGMSAAMGGCESITIHPFDIAYTEPSDFSNRIARNSQIIIKEEAYLNKSIDPSAGSYYIETLTDSIAQHAWSLFQKVEEMKGFVEATKTGFVQDEITKTAQQRIVDVASRKTTILGTNQYSNLNEEMLEKLTTNKKQEAEKKSTYKILASCRVAESYEQVRLATEKYISKGNKRPNVFLLTIGNVAMRRARAGFITNFFGCAGYEVTDNIGFNSVQEGAQAALESEAEIIVLCSSDEEYPVIAPETCKLIKEKNKKAIVLVAGYPKEVIESLKAAGVDDFIHIKLNTLETLTAYQKKLGIIK